jgi:hypothetical protein
MDQQQQLDVFPKSVRDILITHEGRLLLDALAQHIGHRRLQLSRITMTAPLDQIRYESGVLAGMEAIHAALWKMTRPS